MYTRIERSSLKKNSTRHDLNDNMRMVLKRKDLDRQAFFDNKRG